jgi:CelD/BcsL family acetyltransferase involved in cellulose biosynthesis
MAQPQASSTVAAAPDTGRGPVHVALIKRYQDFLSLREQWEAVYDADPDAQFFLSWSFASNWLQKGEENGTNSGGWVILVARPSAETTDCLAILPLRLKMGKSEWDRPITRLMMAGRRYADYTGILCRPEVEREAIPALAEAVKRLAWDQWELEFLRCSDGRLERLLGSFAPPSFRVTAQKTTNRGEDTDKAICPYVELPGSWDEYLAQFNHKSRLKLRRLLHDVERSPELNITHATGDTIQRDIKILLQLWKNQWKEMKGDRLQGLLQVSATMLYRSFLNGSADVAVMWHEHRPISALALWIDDRKRVIYSALSGRDESFENSSPGRVLHAHSIQRAIAKGYKIYDFGRGNEPFKYWFGAADRQVKSVVIGRRGGLATRR